MIFSVPPLQQHNIPTTIVILGATGDLMSKKIAPALFQLFQKQQLPPLFQIIAFARRPLTDDTFRALVRQMLETHASVQGKEQTTEAFLARIFYFQGNFDVRDDYRRLATHLGKSDGEWRVCSNKLFYLAVPPFLYESIVGSLVASGLTDPCGPDEGWTRVIVEKPFGRDMQTANALDTLLSSKLREEQIYRIDHYLGKEIVQNILSFRFSNNLFAQSWNRESIERIDIRLLETIGVGDRGDFYDAVGALRDVGQNHLLQLLALVTMEHPMEFSASAIRARRAALLASLEPLQRDTIPHTTFRGQYAGYRQVTGVVGDSLTETYFKIRAHLAMPRWEGVPMILEAGKYMGAERKEVCITFRHPTPCLCPRETGVHYKNTITFTLAPHEEIVMRIWLKKPGLTYTIAEQVLRFSPAGASTDDHIDAHERLILDVIHGDQTMFVSTPEVRAMWQFIDPILAAWHANVVPLHVYEQGANDARIQSMHVEAM